MFAGAKAMADTGMGLAKVEHCNIETPLGCVMIESAVGNQMSTAPFNPAGTQCNVGPIPAPINHCYQVVKCFNPNPQGNPSSNVDTCHIKGEASYDLNGNRPIAGAGVSYATFLGPRTPVTCNTGRTLKVRPLGSSSSKEDLCLSAVISHPVSAAAIPAKKKQAGHKTLYK